MIKWDSRWEMMGRKNDGKYKKEHTQQKKKLELYDTITITITISYV